MDKLLKPYAGLIISHSSLMSVLTSYQAPNFKIHRWLDEGQLLAVKRGLYVVSPKISGVPISLPLVANHLYGPSYVSLEFALSYYGLIPEKVIQITSVTTKRAKPFENVLGRFSYQHLPTTYYSLGIKYVKLNDQVAFMIASREKALCDWLVLTANLKIYSVKGLETLLLEDLRLDEMALITLDAKKVRHFAEVGIKSKLLNLLADWLEV